MKYFILACLLPAFAFAHAYPERSEPKVGSSGNSAPTSVKIWFDSDLENKFNSIQVKDSSGKQVDKKDTQLVDAKCLEVTVEQLSSGTYQVYWNVLSRDGHKTEGDYTFSVQ